MLEKGQSRIDKPEKLITLSSRDKDKNNEHFGRMSYNVSTVLHSVIYSLLLFALHKAHGTRRLYTSCRRMWQILHCNCSDYIKHDLSPGL